MVDSVNPSQFTPIQDIDLDSLDLESAMMAVQMRRADNLENQLRDQLKEVQRRNDQNTKLNDFLQNLVAVSNSFDSGAKNEDKAGDKGYEIGKSMSQFAKNANLVMDFFRKQDNSVDLSKEKAKLLDYQDAVKRREMELGSLHKDEKSYITNPDTGEKKLTAEAKKRESEIISWLNEFKAGVSLTNARISDMESAAKGNFSKSTTKGEIETAISKIKGMLDTNNSTNQLDMLRLQSLNSKRNEAFELLTNFIKKMLDSRLSIIANMR